MQPKTYYDWAIGQDYRIDVHQGGSSSGKTWSIIQRYLELMHHNKGKGLVLSVVRATLPALRRSVLRDFYEVCEASSLRFEENKSTHTFNVFGNTWEFFSADEGEKLRGPRRDLLWCNEATELTLEKFRQLEMRTRKHITLDYNPSWPTHWIYNEVIPRENTVYFESNYTHNPFNSPEVVSTIEGYRDSDPDFWRVYGLGKRGLNRLAIFVATQSEVPETAKLVGYGLDWGFTNDPTALVSVHQKDQNLYIKEHLYQRGMTNDLISETILPIVGRHPVICDSSEPKSIEELSRWGVTAKPALKGPDSVRTGIDKMKRYKLHYYGDNIGREMSSYRWKTDKEGNTIPIPEDKDNHTIDAARYVVLNLLDNYNGRYSIS